MSVQYYASFLVKGSEPHTDYEYHGVVELYSSRSEPGEDELAGLLADNFEVEPEDIVVHQWGRLH